MPAPAVVEAEPVSPPPPPTSTRRRPVVAIATWSARHRWLALAIWIAFVASAIVGGSAVGGKELDESSMTVGASGPADIAMQDADFGELPSESILIQRGTLDPAAADAAVAELTAAAAAVPGVDSVSPPIPSQDGGSLLVEVVLAET